MALPFLQADYGVFDTKFLGVCLRYHASAPDAFERFLALVKGEPLALAGLDHASLHDLAVASVLDHEFRHLHDFVLSPHGNKIFRLRLAAIFHGMQSIETDLRLAPVPTPLIRWSRMTAHERRASEHMWRRPVLSLDSLDPDTLGAAEKNYAQILACLVSESEIQSVDLYEASAMLVQVYAIYRIAGQKAADLFYAGLLGGAVPTRYVRVLHLLSKVWRKLGRDIDLREFGAIVSWSLLGTFGKRPTDDLPTRRFLRLLIHFTQEPACDFNRSVKEIYADWDTALGYVSIEQAIHENAVANDALALLFNNVPPDQGDTLFRVVAGVCREGIQALIAANKAMAALYRASPESYVYPDAYIDNTEKIGASIRFDFLDMAYRSDALRRRGFDVDVEIAEPHSGVDFAVTAYLHPGGNNAIDGRVASRVALNLTACDFLFSDMSRDDMDFRLARQQLRTMGIETRELL